MGIIKVKRRHGGNRRKKSKQRKSGDNKFNGCASYKDYLQSKHWKKMRRHYCHQSALCYACDKRDKPLQLHHIYYTNLGREEARDFIVMCKGCHEHLHNVLRDKFPKKATAFQSARTDSLFPELFGRTLEEAVTRYNHSEQWSRFAQRYPTPNTPRKKKHKVKLFEPRPTKAPLPNLCVQCKFRQHKKKSANKLCADCNQAHIKNTVRAMGAVRAVCINCERQFVTANRLTQLCRECRQRETDKALWANARRLPISRPVMSQWP